MYTLIPTPLYGWTQHWYAIDLFNTRPIEHTLPREFKWFDLVLSLAPQLQAPLGPHIDEQS